jgi:hypothetical protein
MYLSLSFKGFIVIHKRVVNLICKLGYYKCGTLPLTNCVPWNQRTNDLCLAPLGRWVDVQ